MFFLVCILVCPWAHARLGHLEPLGPLGPLGAHGMEENVFPWTLVSLVYRSYVFREVHLPPMGGVTSRKCTCAKFDADLANLANMYIFSKHDFPHTMFIDAIFDFGKSF